jgi:hypothetical protein
MKPRHSAKNRAPSNHADIQKAISFNNQYKVARLEQALGLYTEADERLD